MRCQYIREAVKNDEINVVYIPTNNQIADILTKQIPSTGQFFYLRSLILNCCDSKTGYDI